MATVAARSITAERRRVRLSLTLSRYLARQVLFGILAILLALGTVAFVIDVVEHLRRASDKEEAKRRIEV